MPLRGAMAATAARGVSSITQLGGMGGGQGGQGGRGGGRGGNNFEERAGATRILRILPEGSVVAKDDIVCWLDAASFEDALRQQNITHAEAKSWVEQAKVSLEVAQMELEEYKKGIYPQDFEQLTKYVIICETQCQQNRRNTAWEREMLARNLRGPSQLRASELSLEQAETALREAKTMLNTLKSYTGPKVIKNLEAKIESVRSDYLAQESSFKLEDERKRKLEATIANCILRAPRDGIVVYESQANSWGRVEDLIQEGATVREDQPIFSIPDPTRMRVRAKINESKVMLVETGVPTQVRIDAFPDEEFTGSVAGVTPIPAPAAGPISDIKIYVAMIDFDTEGFNRLRTGMTAEVSFIKEQKRGVLRIPVTAIRFLNGAPFVAQRDARSKAVTWKPIQIGLANRAHAEVTGGLKEGERIVTDATRLVPPSPPGRSESSPGEPPPNPGAISALLPVRK
jgi:multidrug resistance efflux pump